jgi:hypothetical protein
VSPGGEISGIAEHSIGPPCDEVRDPGRHVEAAPRAEVRLDRLRLGDWLDVPLATVAQLRATPSGREAIDVEFGMRLTSTGGSST